MEQEAHLLTELTPHLQGGGCGIVDGEVGTGGDEGLFRCVWRQRVESASDWRRNFPAGMFPMFCRPTSATSHNSKRLWVMRNIRPRDDRAAMQPRRQEILMRAGLISRLVQAGPVPAPYRHPLRHRHHWFRYATVCLDVVRQGCGHPLRPSGRQAMLQILY